MIPMLIFSQTAGFTCFAAAEERNPLEDKVIWPKSLFLYPSYTFTTKEKKQFSASFLYNFMHMAFTYYFCNIILTSLGQSNRSCIAHVKENLPFKQVGADDFTRKVSWFNTNIACTCII